jgi:hypothetical protein
LNPHLRDVLDFQHKFGLAFLMSDFSCCWFSLSNTIAWSIAVKAGCFKISSKFSKYRFYGNIKVYDWCRYKWEDGEMKKALV